MHGRVFFTKGTPRLWWVIGLLVCFSTTLTAEPGGDTVLARQRVQESLDAIKVRLGLPNEVTAQLVDEHPLVVAVAPAGGRVGGFQISAEAAFIGSLTDEELDAVIAHELGHVWIFTHHPYLQTEQLANDIAMRVVERRTLEAVYAKIRARGGHTGGPPRFADSKAN